MNGSTAHHDTFVRDRLPPPEQWPDFINLDQLDYPERLNCVVELLDNAVSEGHGERVCVRAPSLSWSYAELQAQVNRIAQVLTDDLSLLPGERVLLRSANNPMVLACWLAVVKAGAIAVATMPLLRARELSAIGEKARPRLALCDQRLVDALHEARPGLPWLEKIVTFHVDGELEALTAAKDGRFSAVDTYATDPCLVAFTSGTTGSPKGAVQFHRDVLASCDAFNRGVLKPTPDDVFIGSPPLAFTFGLGGLALFPMQGRSSTVLIEAAPPDQLARAIQDYRATTVFTAPTAYRAMLNADVDLSSLRQCVSAGETLPRPIFDAWLERTGLRIIDGLGSTELLHIFISAAGDDIRPGSTGKPIPYYEAKIVDDSGQSLPPNTVGRLAVRGPTGCRYLDDPRQTQYVVDGWNLTGDAYLMDDDGYFWFQARADDMIISAGYNIAGPEVEEALLAHEAVAECAVVSAPDPERGQIVKAFVVTRPDYPADEALIKTLQDFVKASIAPYKYPRAVEFIDALPRTETGKVQRFKLRQREQEKAL